MPRLLQSQSAQQGSIGQLGPWALLSRSFPRCVTKASSSLLKYGRCWRSSSANFAVTPWRSLRCSCSTFSKASRTTSSVALETRPPRTPLTCSAPLTVFAAVLISSLCLPNKSFNAFLRIVVSAPSNVLMMASLTRHNSALSVRVCSTMNPAFTAYATSQPSWSNSEALSTQSLMVKKKQIFLKAHSTTQQQQPYQAAFIAISWGDIGASRDTTSTCVTEGLRPLWRSCAATMRRRTTLTNMVSKQGTGIKGHKPPTTLKKRIWLASSAGSMLGLALLEAMTAFTAFGSTGGFDWLEKTWP
mmetsp:Transcript_48713/g.110320  ORF Transcript_48713/g.110320 Transcript_48713/m.110320 type:complete len:301 (+) Transcript_48713:96-998(+)